MLAEQPLHFMSNIAGFPDFSKSPSPLASSDSECYSDSDEEEDKLYKNPTNQAPTKSRPEFRKFGPRDFRFLKVLGKGRYGNDPM